jgi:hypothetical protein
MRGERIFASLAGEEGDALDMAQTSVALVGFKNIISAAVV